MCGTNDASTKKQPDKIIHEGRQLLVQAKQKAVKVIMSSILPRQNANKTEEEQKQLKEKIDAINQMLVVLCNEENVIFVNHDENVK